MHEMSFVRALLDQVDRVHRAHPATVLNAVRVEVGPLAGVEPQLLAGAFELLASQRYTDVVELLIDEVPLQVDCGNCHQQTEVHEFVFRCADCDSSDVTIISGDSLVLVSVSLRPVDSCLEIA